MSLVLQHITQHTKQKQASVALLYSILILVQQQRPSVVSFCATVFFGEPLAVRPSAAYMYSQLNSDQRTSEFI